MKPSAGVMAKPVNLARYDMSSFLESCVENYCNLAKVSPLSLKEVPTPFTDAGIARPTLSEDEKPGKLQPVASKIRTKILFAAPMARVELLRRVTKWSIECGVSLHRLVAYINCTKHNFLEGFMGMHSTNASSGYLRMLTMPESMTARAHPGAPSCW